MSTAPTRPRRPQARRNLTVFAWLSVAAALATIGMKTYAWWITGSVGLLSDAAESVVNLVAAVGALIALRIAAAPADEHHLFGHTKAEYLSAAVEGAMIFVAAMIIIWQAVLRFLDPQPLENVGIGLGVSVAASVVNGVVAAVLLRAGRKHRSITLKADGKHLMTDVWTSAGVVVGVLLVAVTGIERLDPVVAMAVGINIVVSGWALLDESSRGLMDGSMSEDDNVQVAATIARFQSAEVDFHGLRTRVAGHRAFAQVHVLVPGDWSVQRGHDLVERVEDALHVDFPELHILCHLEPAEDPRAYDDFEAEIPIEPEPPGTTTATDRTAPPAAP